MGGSSIRRGRLVPAPENHVTQAQVLSARRSFIAGATAAVAAVASVRASAQTATEASGHEAVVPQWTRSLGAPVAASGYGAPSKYESNVQRRQSPGLTRTNQSSVSFTPLQNLFGIVTPSGVHFERHHSGVPEVDPMQHKLLVHGLVERPL